jgi:hypothetical protein
VSSYSVAESARQWYAEYSHVQVRAAAPATGPGGASGSASLRHVKRALRPAPPPLEGNDVAITMVGTVAWAVSLIVLLAVREQLPPADRWWIWVAAFGCFMGLFGLVYVPHLKRSRERAAQRRNTTSDGEPQG